MSAHSSSTHSKLTLAGVIVSLGIIYGDIGTSPLYVFSAILGNNLISKEIVYGGLSAVFWTMMLITTVKYVIITLEADNNGEGGILSLFSLVKRKRNKGYLMFVAILGGAMMLADSIITPPISVSSAIEGLRFFDKSINTLPLILIVIIGIFLFQQLGTSKVGKSFGPIMFVWFIALAVFGSINLITYPEVLTAINPLYAFKLVTGTFTDPATQEAQSGFWMLGSVFLCATGAEALFADLGHVGKANIRVSWYFVLICLLLNYFGQAAFLMHEQGTTLDGVNPFFAMVSDNWRVFMVVLACIAAVIASQAVISGSYTMINEAIRNNIFPKVHVKYPSETQGQIYIPLINTFLLIGCILVVLIFRESKNMEGAYGLAITLTMIMTTILLREYFIMTKKGKFYTVFLFGLFMIIETMFFVSNIAKFSHGGYFSFLVSCIFILIMFSRYRTVNIKLKSREYVPISDYLDQLKELSKDQSLPKYATNLVFLTTSKNVTHIEYKILYSILQRQPKRADNYWFVHVQVTKHPYTCEYKVDTFAKDDVYRITFYLGFKVEEKISQFLRVAIEDMVKNGEVNIVSRYHSLKEKNTTGDFKFVLLEEILSTENEISFWDRLAININLWLKSFTATPDKWFNLDTNLVEVEKVPLVVHYGMKEKLTRIYEKPKNLD